jgi:hypothetical protein
MDAGFDLHSPQVAVLMNTLFRSLSSPAPPARSACTPPISLPNHPTCNEGALASASAPSRPNQKSLNAEDAKDAEEQRNEERETRNVKRETVRGCGNANVRL